MSPFVGCNLMADVECKVETQGIDILPGLKARDSYGAMREHALA